MDVASFWNRVKLLVSAHKITQAEFAAHIGMPLSTFRKWLHYKRIPDLQSAINIAASLGVSLDYLINGKEMDAVEEDKKKRSVVKEAVARMHDDMEHLDNYF